jgi:phosphoglycerate dehydrogenase-like enzyme
MRVLVHSDRPDPLAKRLRDRFPDIEIGTCDSYDGLAAAIADVRPDAQFHIRFENKPYPADALKAAPGLSWIAVGGVGVDHLGMWDTDRLTVTNGAGVAAHSMAWYAIGGMAALAMQYPRFMRDQARHAWRPGTVGRLDGKTVAIIGLGQTGQAVAAKAAALGLRVIGIRARPRPMAHVETVYGAHALHDVLAQADVVVVALPRTARTLGLLGRTAFAAVKPGAYLIDVSRGGIVVAAALVEALKSGQVGGAVIDVYDPEPMPADAELWDMDNVIVTPHSSAVYEGWEFDALDIFADNVARVHAGEPLVNVVDPVRGY